MSRCVLRLRASSRFLEAGGRRAVGGRGWRWAGRPVSTPRLSRVRGAAPEAGTGPLGALRQQGRGRAWHVGSRQPRD